MSSVSTSSSSSVTTSFTTTSASAAAAVVAVASAAAAASVATWQDTKALRMRRCLIHGAKLRNSPSIIINIIYIEGNLLEQTGVTFGLHRYNTYLPVIYYM